MSRPDRSLDEPRLPRAQRTVHRRSAAVPLRVVAQRVDRIDRIDVEPAAGAPAPRHPGDVVLTPRAALRDSPEVPTSGPVPTAVAGVPATGAVATLQQAPLPSPDVVGLPVLADRAPALDRRHPITRLFSLVRGRRQAEAGRHRPDTIPSRGWSMFAPHRRSRRRFGVRR